MNYKIISVHGTFASAPTIRGDLWWQKDSPFCKEVLSYLGGDEDRVFWEPFVWSGSNSLLEREKAGRDLAAQMDNSSLQPEERVYLCHSHGGNVFWQAKRAKLPKDKWPRSITVGTPFLPELALGFLMLSKKTANILLFISVLSLITQKVFNFSIQVDWLLLVLTIAGIGSWVFVAIYGAAFDIAAKDLWGTGGRINQIIGFSFALRLAERWQSRHRKRFYEKIVQYNLDDVKIFSCFDEAILGLMKAHRQKINLANRRNAMIPSTMFLTVLLLVLILISLQIMGITVWNDSRLSGFVIFNVDNVGAIQYFSRISLDQEIIRVLNITTDILIFPIMCYYLARIISVTPASKIFIRLFNHNLYTILLNKAVGKDGTFSVSVPNKISPNLPILFGEYEIKDQWRAMPPDFDSGMKDILDSGTIETARAIRETMAMGVLAGEFNLFDSVAKNFSGEELVHTSYFRHPDFAAFVAWILIHEFRFPPSEKFRQLECTDKLANWYSSIQPESLSSADRDKSTAS